jgi:putative tryptophan/tyrosine transport system substrate-binding protein
VVREALGSVRRRDFIKVIAGAAAAWPRAARAQQKLPVVGFLNSGAAATLADRVASFLNGLGEAGYVEGRNVAMEYRWAEGQYQRLPVFAADLVGRQVSVIAAGGPPAAQAAKAATSIIPIVFTSGADPVEAGLVASFNRPGGNVTGVHLFLAGLAEKKLGLLRLLVPQASTIAVLLNPSAAEAEPQSKSVQTAARSIGQQIQILYASNEQEIDAAFASIVARHVGALVVGSDPYFFLRHQQIIALAARHAIPTVYDLRENATAGGLISYGTSLGDAYREAGRYTGRILKGEKPADLPVLQSTKFELVINLKTAKTLGLDISDNFLTLADEVIE